MSFVVPPGGGTRSESLGVNVYKHTQWYGDWFGMDLVEI